MILKTIKLKHYSKKRRWKLLLVFFAILISTFSLYFTNQLMKKLAAEEKKRISLWAQATQELINSDSNQDVSFLFEVLKNNETIPVLLLDADDNILSYRNIDSLLLQNDKYKKQIIEKFKNNGKESFAVVAEDGTELNKIYYSDSLLLKQLHYYPYLQLAIVFLFILVSYIAFSISRKKEQNQVWLGMSKETAHQLGTPISSLMAWIEILKNSNNDQEMIDELSKDVIRLEKITSRFSMIGSRPQLVDMDLASVVQSGINYIQTRIPSSIQITTNFDSIDRVMVPINPDLFEWVIENLCKNAVDAMGAKGQIDIVLEVNKKNIYLDIIDNGKGIPKKYFKTIFQPGFTTKDRGWGLGLSLVARIIEQYHKGKIFVKHSELEVGTCFRIILSRYHK